WHRRGHAPVSLSAVVPGRTNHLGWCARPHRESGTGNQTFMNSASTRLLHGVALLCVGGVGVALVSQRVFDMPPCAWCVLQRLLFLAIAAVCWLGVLLGRASGVAPRIAGMLATVLAAAGVLAGWYQYSVAAQMFSCERSEEHTSELQSRGKLVCRLLLE